MLKDEFSYLYSLKDSRTQFKLEGMKKVMQILGNLDAAYKTIHVGGTNGKGSTCAYLAEILQQAGYNVGLYTSPHLLHYNERIQVNRKNISDKEIKALILEIRKKLSEHNLTTTFFELTTAMAFLYFARKKVDIAVIEVGLGGKLDATNVITPLVSIITNIDLEHTEILGDTVEKIASEKAGIIKENVPLVTTEQKESVLKVFKKQCQEKNSLFYHADVSVLGNFRPSLRGKHQKFNAAAAVRAVKILQEQGWSIPEKALKQGIEEAFWPGRFQVVSKKPFIVVDCAHNPEGIHVLADVVKKIRKRHLLLLATAQDKDSEEMVHIIAPLFKKVIVTEGNYRAKSAEKLGQEVQEYVPDVEIIPECRKAVQRALSLVQKDELFLVTGSIYMVGEALQYLKQQGKK